MGRLVLALDNSLDFLNVALGEDGRLIEERHTRTDRLSSEVLPLRVGGLLGDHGYSVTDVSLLVVTLGPGSFTGVRVGLAFSKGLARGLAIPLVGVPTLDALASPLASLEEGYLCPLIDAKKGEVFLALYRASGGALARITGFQALKPPELESVMPSPCLCFGSGVKLCSRVLLGIEGVRFIEDGFQRVSGEGLLKLGLSLYDQGSLSQTSPIYGRRSEAEIRFGVNVSP